jgi:very-short-patch-repair endonuclease
MPPDSDPSPSRRATMLERRRVLRREATPAERALWRLLRSRQLAGIKVRRQVQAGPYILDFYAPSKRLAIEADGGQHYVEEGREYDEARTAFLNARGVRVLRFTNREILEQPAAVLEVIERVLLRGAPSP